MSSPIEVKDYIDAQVKLIHELRAEGVIAKGIYLREDMNIPVESMTREFVMSRCVAGTQRESVGGGPAASIREGTTTADSTANDTKTVLLVTVEAIHPGLTKNLTYYADNHLEASAGSWTTPYNKPVLKNHNPQTEPLGRVISAEMVESMLKPGTRALRIVHRITDPDTIAKVVDGRYQTTSIGGTAKSLTCSICASNLMENWCDHYRGRTYEGKTAYWIVGPLEFDEDSYVNVPADELAQITSWEWEDAQGSPTTGASAHEGRERNVEGNVLAAIDTLTGNQVTEEAQADAEQNTEAPPTEEAAADAEQAVGDAEIQTEESDPVQQLAEATTRVAELEGAVTELEEKVADLEEKLQAANTQILALSTSTDESKIELETANGEVTRLLKQNVELAKFAHRQMVEKVVDLRIAIGEAAEDKRAELITELSGTKAADLAELAKTAIANKPARVVAHVTSPGQINHDPATGTALEGANGAQAKQYTMDDLAESFIGMLNGTRIDI